MPWKPPVHRPAGWSPAKRVRTDAMDRFYDTAAWQRLREQIKRRDGHRCTAATCRTPDRGHGGRLIVDHIVPRRQGGSDAPDNLRTLCPACDNRRHGQRGARG